MGRNITSVTPGDKETDAKMCGAIMKPENGIRHNLCPGAKPRKWGKLPMNDYTKKETTPAAATTDRLRSESEN
jgi:hypothetical protein